MINFILLLILHLQSYMGEPIELKSTDIVKIIGQPLKGQSIFSIENLTESSALNKEIFFPKIINYTILHTDRYRFHQIPVDELHLKVDTNGLIAAIFIQLDTPELLNKLVSIAGDDYIAAGTSEKDENKYSFYGWDYQKGCIALETHEFKQSIRQRLLTNYNLLIFYNCDPSSYQQIPKEDYGK